MLQRNYLLIKKLSVQNANAIAGLTYGFPAMTNFLGFVHALSRKLTPDLNLSLGGVAVVSHHQQVHVRQPKGWGDYVFALTRNPLTSQGKTAPINEEGRMNLQVSLLVDVEGFIAGAEQLSQRLIEELTHLIPQLRLAGGQIMSFESIELLTGEVQQQQAVRQLMPGSVLVDRSDYLADHFKALKANNSEISLFDAWCDFVQIKHQAQKVDHELEEVDSEQATWNYVQKPNAGYLVPIATGYCAISPLYEAGEITNMRDTTTPARFVETAYSIGEWLSVHRLTNIEAGLWRYQYSEPWYLATNNTSHTQITEPDTFGEELIDPDLI